MATLVPKVTSFLNACNSVDIFAEGEDGGGGGGGGGGVTILFFPYFLHISNAKRTNMPRKANAIINNDKNRIDRSVNGNIFHFLMNKTA